VAAIITAVCPRSSEGRILNALPDTRICRYYSQRPCRDTARNFMQFVSDYMKAIDFVALAALVVIAAASLSRGGTVWLLVAAIVVAIWGASRLFGLF
jgi:hypothetical protein